MGAKQLFSAVFLKTNNFIAIKTILNGSMVCCFNLSLEIFRTPQRLSEISLFFLFCFYTVKV